MLSFIMAIMVNKKTSGSYLKKAPGPHAECFSKSQVLFLSDPLMYAHEHYIKTVLHGSLVIRGISKSLALSEF